MQTKKREAPNPKPVNLENWSLVPAGRNMSLRGAVFNDPLRKDGTQAMTAVIRRIERPFVITSNGVKYKLGNVDSEWVRDFPGCVERFWAAADKI